jgi:hypothetical protein
MVRLRGGCAGRGRPRFGGSGRFLGSEERGGGRGSCGKRGDGRSQQGRATGRRSTWLVGLHGGILVLRRWKSGLKLCVRREPPFLL